MNSCEFVTSITAIACVIANNCPKEDLPLIASALSQLGDTLATIEAHQELCKDAKE